MALHRFSASGLVPAPATQVYALLADYQVGHPSILPKPDFVSLTVDKGGVGAGTAITFQMRIMGRVQTFHSAVTEPEPGRVLMETVTENGFVTTFTVEPHGTGAQSPVTIMTDVPVPGGPVGALQGWLTAQALRPIYVKELEQIAIVVATTVTQP